MSEPVRAALAAVVEGRTLDLETARLAMGSVMDGEATPAQLAALLVALRMRGETVDELAGFATAMRERVLRVDAPEGTIDVVGTGGDGSGTFNISTTSALVVAAAGVPVAKHGNRAITSRSGAADVLEALGVRVDHSAETAAADLRDLGFAFLFAPGFHPAMRHAGPTRREIGVRTAFNLLGPLTNPAGATRALLGVGDATAAPRMAEVVEMLKVPEPSPPVPTTSIVPSGASTRRTRSRIAIANPASSSTVSPRIRRATRSAASWAGVASPSMTEPIASRATSRSSVRPSMTAARAARTCSLIGPLRSPRRAPRWRRSRSGRPGATPPLPRRAGGSSRGGAGPGA